MIRFAALLVLGVLASCAQTGDTQSQGADRTVVIEMRDNHFEPDKLEVRRGESIAFRFMNTGDVRHDAFIGDEKAQKDHEDEMRMAEDQGHSAGHVAGDEEAITVEPNKTGRLTYTFDEAGETIIGCHEAGHYEDGMTVTVTVT